ncbi:DNA-directed RNA polymerase II core subunit RPB11 [Pneumocystis jirovecii RU7]|nr:DNA-directed RNA polymerase II core subunit RPB11 [Pneumocystis jirovecii RU7]KTW32428.1 hypothetical protein T551_00518 [Pneumocystis jirovecii RU7]
MTNIPERWELLLLPEGKKKVTFDIDPKVPNAANITVLNEDHTLGNMLRAQLLQDERVLFAGYRVSHPILEHKFVLRVQTEEGYEPRDAVSNASRDLLYQLTQLRNNFEREWELKKVAEDYME